MFNITTESHNLVAMIWSPQILQTKRDIVLLSAAQPKGHVLSRRLSWSSIKGETRDGGRLLGSRDNDLLLLLPALNGSV